MKLNSLLSLLFLESDGLLRNKKMYILLTLPVLFISLFFFIEHSDTKANDLSSFKELSLRQAIKLAEAETLKWNSNA
jgi:hypothetical protein